MRRIFSTAILIALALFLGAQIVRSSANNLQQATVWMPLIYGQPHPTPTLTPSPVPTIPPKLPTVRVDPTCCQFDAPGDDRQNLNEEFVCFQNLDSAAVSMDGWQVRDEAGATYTFPAFELAPKEFVTLHTGTGVDTSTDLYWGMARAVWNNGGDTVYLYNASGELIDQYSY